MSGPGFKVSLIGRKVTPAIALIRDRLRLIPAYKEPLRYTDQMAKRTQPPPSLPEGSSSSLSANAYCSRDGRRFCEAPESVFIGKSLTSGEVKEISPSVSKVPPSMPRA